MCIEATEAAADEPLSQSKEESKIEDVGKFDGNSDEEKETFGIKFLKYKEGVQHTKKNDNYKSSNRGSVFS